MYFTSSYIPGYEVAPNTGGNTNKSCKLLPNWQQ